MTDISSSPSTAVTGEFFTQENWRCARCGFQVLSASMAESLNEVKPSRKVRVPVPRGKLHHDGAILHPGQRDAVIKFAHVAERRGCEKGERGRQERVANFH